MSRARVAVIALLLWGPGCTVPYQPLQARIAHVGADAFAQAAEAVRQSYGRLAVADPSAFRIQSHWVVYDRPGVAARKRATVFVDDGDRVNVVVETRYFRIGLLREPAWSGIVGDPALERELMASVMRALEGT